MNDVNKIGIATMRGDGYTVTVNVGWIVLEHITRVEGGVERKEQLAIHVSE
jgi:hypothetical protein